MSSGFGPESSIGDSLSELVEAAEKSGGQHAISHTTSRSLEQLRTILRRGQACSALPNGAREGSYAAVRPPRSF